AMPVPVAAGELRRKHKADLRLAALPDDPQRPVLIVSRKLRRSGAALADDISRLPVAQRRRVDPRFESDLVAVGEVEVASRSGVGDWRSEGRRVGGRRRGGGWP